MTVPEIQDLVLSLDLMEILVEQASKEYKEYNVNLYWDVLKRAYYQNIRLWVHVGLLNAVYERCGYEGKSSEAQKNIKKLLEYAIPLAALSEDVDALCHFNDPYVSQLEYAAKRLGHHGRIVCLHPLKALSSDLCITLHELEEYLNSESFFTIPFVDLRTQQNKIRRTLEQNLFRVLVHGQYVRGAEILELEERLARYLDVRHCVVCSSGTDALLLSLLALGIGPGDAVFTTPFTFIATAEVIAQVGATPVFVDIDSSTFVINPEQLDKVVRAIMEPQALAHPLPKPRSSSLRPRAVIPVDLFGFPCDYSAIEDVASRYGMHIIEDAAQAFGAERDGRKAGSFGDLGCTSFFPAKPLGCYGDGGAVFTNSDNYADVLRSLRDHGQGSTPYEHLRVGLNARMDTIQAAVLLSKLEIFQRELNMRQEIADYYNRLLENIPLIRLPIVDEVEGIRSTWAQYCILFERPGDRETARMTLKSKGIPTAIYYPIPLHLQPAFTYLGYKKGDFPVAELCSERILALPIHPYLSEEVIKEIALIITELSLS